MPVSCPSGRPWNALNLAHSVGVSPPRAHVVCEHRDYKRIVQSQPGVLGYMMVSDPERPQLPESYSRK